MAWTRAAGNRVLYLMLLPGLLLMLAYKYLPMAGLVICFENFSLSGGIFGSRWVGLRSSAFPFRSSSR